MWNSIGLNKKMSHIGVFEFKLNLGLELKHWFCIYCLHAIGKFLTLSPLAVNFEDR